MIEETAQVVDVREGYAWIQSERSGSCHSCAARPGCGSGALARVIGRRPVRLRVVNRIDARVGDHVVIGISESWLLRGSLAVYAVPLAGLFAGAVSGYAAGSQLAPQWPADPLAIAGAVAGFVAALGWLRGYGRRTARDPACQPVLLRHQSAAGVAWNGTTTMEN